MLYHYLSTSMCVHDGGPYSHYIIIMALPFGIFEACDVLQPPETHPFDPLLLQARVAYYEYVSATFEDHWQVEDYMKNDFHQIAVQHERTLASNRRILARDPVLNDMDSRIAFAHGRERNGHSVFEGRGTARSRTSTPLELYEGGQRHTSEHPPETVIKHRQGEGIKAGWLGDLRREQESACEENEQVSDSDVVEQVIVDEPHAHEDEVLACEVLADKVAQVEMIFFYHDGMAHWATLP